MSPLALHELEPSSAIRLLLFDVDDTFTQHAQIDPQALHALWRWREAGRMAVAVTGRPAGWCDHFARMWPLDGVIGENGAFWFRHHPATRHMERQYIGQPEPGSALQMRLKAAQDLILAEFPHARISQDQAFRLYDLAIDFCEDVQGLTLDDAHRIAQRLRELGMTAKVSSIHVNAWFGDHDKCTTSRRYLQDCHGLDLAQQASSVVYVGDSPNDEPMFQAFPLSVGVANVEPHLPRMAHPPRFITPSAQAQGFVELVNQLLR
jgi:HAD superfamily hydrolase (TIGR01484 family)